MKIRNSRRPTTAHGRGLKHNRHTDRLGHTGTRGYCFTTVSLLFAVKRKLVAADCVSYFE